MKETETYVNKIDYGMIDQIRRVDICLENCEGYELKGTDIADIFFDDFDVDENGDLYSNKGTLTIKKSAFMTQSSFSAWVEENTYLINRLTHWRDVTSITVHFVNKTYAWFGVPYDPVCDARGDEIEDSNCNSAELDDNGDLTLGFGELSTSPKRIDLPWQEYVLGYKNLLRNADDLLKVEISDIDYDCHTELVPELQVTFRIRNKECRGKKIELYFYDVAEFRYSSFSDLEYDELYISRLCDGRIHVSLYEQLSFYCRLVCVSDYGYVPIDRNYGKKTSLKAINCELSEEEMRICTHNHSVHYEKGFNKEAYLQATDKVNDGQISVAYYSYWLKFYAVGLCFYYLRSLPQYEASKEISQLMYREYLDLCYKKDYAEAKDLIRDYTEKIKGIADRTEW